MRGLVNIIDVRFHTVLKLSGTEVEIQPELMSILNNKLRSLGRDHDRRGIGVARRNRGHHGRIDHTQSFEANRAQPCIDDGSWIRIQPHFGGANGVKDRRSDISRGFCQRRIAVVNRRTGKVFHGVEALQRLLIHQTPRDSDCIGRDVTILFSRQIVGRDDGLGSWIQ